MASGGKNDLLLLERDKFYFYDGDGILTLDFPAKIIRDIEVVDRGEFDGLVEVL